MEGSTVITINTAGIVLSVDRNCCRLFGYDLDELIGFNVNRIIPTPYREQHDSYLDNYMRTGVPKIIGKSRIVEGQHKDGTVFPIRLSVSKMQQGDEVIFVGMIDRLEDSSLSITISIKGNIVSCGQNIQSFFGYSPEEVIGNNVSMLMADPHRSKHDSYLTNYLGGGQPKVIGSVRNVAARHRNGTVFPISLQVEHVKIGSLQLFRGRLEKVNAIEAMFTVDEQGMIVSANHNFVQPLFGYSTSDLVGKNISVLIPNIHSRTETSSSSKRVRMGDDKAQFDSFSSVGTASWRIPGQHEFDVRHNDGSIFPVQLEVKVFKGSDGRTMYSARIQRTSYADDQSQRSESTVGEYMVLRTIGQGTYGKVKLAYRRDDQQRKVAIKVLQKNKMSAAELERTRREVAIMERLDHKHIARLFDVVETEQSLNLVMEYGCRTLLSYVMERGGLPEVEVHRFFVQIASAIQFCHLQGVVHRDIKHQNILLDEFGMVKIIDFGLSNYMSEGKLRSTFCGTPAYAAPEMILGKPYVGPEVDIWSMGVVLYSMCSAKFPFENVCDILSGSFTNPVKLSPELSDLIGGMLQVDVSKRMNMEQILAHPWTRRMDLEETSSANVSANNPSGLWNPQRPGQTRATSTAAATHQSSMEAVPQDAADTDERGNGHVSGVKRTRSYDGSEEAGTSGSGCPFVDGALLRRPGVSSIGSAADMLTRSGGGSGGSLAGASAASADGPFKMPMAPGSGGGGSSSSTSLSSGAPKKD